MSASGAPLCPVCQSATAAWEIDSPVRALDRVVLQAGGVQLVGLVAPDEGLEPVDRPQIRCAACRTPAIEERLREAVLVAATAAHRGEAPRFDA